MELLDCTIIFFSFSILISCMLIKNSKTITGSQIDKAIIYIYTIGMFLTTANLIATIIIYAKSILSLTYIDVIIVTDTYILSVHRINSTYLK